MASFVSERLAVLGSTSKLHLGIEDAAALQEGLAAIRGFPAWRLDRFHPLPMRVRTLLEPIDPMHAAPLVPHQTTRPKPVLQVSGMLDCFDPPGVSEPLTVAHGL